MLVIKDGLKEGGEATRCFIPHLGLGGIHEIRVLVATEKGIQQGESLRPSNRRKVELKKSHTDLLQMFGIEE